MWDKSRGGHSEGLSVGPSVSTVHQAWGVLQPLEIVCKISRCLYTFLWEEHHFTSNSERNQKVICSGF